MDTIIQDAKFVKSPFGYFGSKHRLALRIAQQLPPHHAWVEAFCGSAAVTLSKSPAPIEVINDIDGELVNFFQQLRDNTEQLCRAIELTPYARQELLTARSVARESLSSLERARLFLISSMMAINGAFGEDSGGFSYSSSYARGGMEARVNRWFNLPGRLKAVVQRLRTVRIENRDARELLRMFTGRPASLVYLDPPYLGKRSLGYTRDANDETFHAELLELACKAKCMVLISGYDNALYSTILRPKEGWGRVHISTHTRGSNGKSSKRVEVLWKNRHYCLAEEAKKVPILLSKKEPMEGKVNPVRRDNLKAATIVPPS